MGWRTVTTATLTLHVDVTCEACETAYGYVQVISKSHTSGMFSGPGAEQQVQNELQEGRFGVKFCPKCGYLQHFMHKHWLYERQAPLAILGAGLFVTAGAFLFGWPDKSTWLTVILALLGYFVLASVGAFLGDLLAKALFVPNRAWINRNPDKNPMMRMPQIIPYNEENPSHIDWSTGGAQYCNYAFRPTPVDTKSAFRSLLYSFAKWQMIRNFPVSFKDFLAPARLTSWGPGFYSMRVTDWVLMVCLAIIIWPWVGGLIGFGASSGDPDGLAIFIGILVAEILGAILVLMAPKLRNRNRLRIIRKKTELIRELEFQYTRDCAETLKKYPKFAKAVGNMQRLHDQKQVTQWAIEHIGYRPWTKRQARAMRNARYQQNSAKIDKLLKHNPCLEFLAS